MEDLRRQLLAAFAVEHREHVQAVRAALSPDASPDRREMFRRAHSLKGAARAVDAQRIEALAHELEAVLAPIMSGEGPIGRSEAARTHRLLDEIEEEAEAFASGAPSADVDEDARREADSPDRPMELLRIDPSTARALSEAAHALGRALEVQQRANGELGLVLDLLAQARREGEGLGASARRLRAAQEFAASAASRLRDLRDKQAVAVWSANQALGRIREEAERMSLTSAGEVLGGLPRMLRGLAQEADQPLELAVEGMHTAADRAVLQKLKDPLMHVLRNALSHGSRNRKPGAPPLHVALSMEARAGQLEIRVRDDGPGPDLDRLEAAGRAMGLLPPREDGQRPSPEEVLALAFSPGVSSAAQVDRLAGRGMGLSVVAEALREVGGSARLERAAGGGALVRIQAPQSAARRTVLRLETPGGAYALPATARTRVLRLRQDALESVDGHPATRIEIADRSVVAPVVSLSALLSSTPQPIAVSGGMAPGVLLWRDDRAVVIAADEVSDVLSIMVEPLHVAGLEPSLYLGAGLLDGDLPALVLDPEGLIDRWLRDHQRLIGSGLSSTAPTSLQRTILVVDDSITTRTLEKSLLEAQGYRVVLAVDGLEALERLRGHDAPVDLVVADVEMPRLDGFGLLQAMKADPALSGLPVVLMTSRDSPEDVQRGLELGADAYLAKQAFDQRELLAAIGRLI